VTGHAAGDIRRFDPASDDASTFDCGSDAQSRWLRNTARTAIASRTAVVYVALEPGGHVIGYYALAAASVAQADVSPAVRRSAGRSPIPAVLLARLGVDRSAQGLGVGAALVKDAMMRALHASGAIGARVLLVHAESAEARAFYLHIAEFQHSPTDDLHLALLIRDI
jgi:GNAT superfamily N-acetyltransferase